VQYRFPLKNLDHLFNLPSAPIAAPRMYWGGDNWFTSAFLVVEPREQTMQDLITEMKRTVDQDVFDMDLLNTKFKTLSILLPSEYMCLNSHWETNDVNAFPGYTLESLYADKCFYLHFTAGGKPWSFPPEHENKLSPDAHRLFKYQFQEWWRTSKTVCHE
jgi:lipopolysaccharide biosynthesis glycosyltransferase